MAEEEEDEMLALMLLHRISLCIRFITFHCDSFIMFHRDSTCLIVFIVFHHVSSFFHRVSSQFITTHRVSSFSIVFIATHCDSSRLIVFHQELSCLIL